MRLHDKSQVEGLAGAGQCRTLRGEPKGDTGWTSADNVRGSDACVEPLRFNTPARSWFFSIWAAGLPSEPRIGISGFQQLSSKAFEPMDFSAEDREIPYAVRQYVYLLSSHRTTPQRQNPPPRLSENHGVLGRCGFWPIIVARQPDPDLPGRLDWRIDQRTTKP